MTMTKLHCCICGKEFEDYTGNNPWPVVDDDESVCCSDCNESVVIPARIALVSEVKSEEL